MKSIRIEEIREEYFDNFLRYFTSHLSENGDDRGYFLPLTREQSQFSEAWMISFQTGLRLRRNEPGWRKLWVAISPDDRIVGHIDIRSRNEANTEHRVLLGMGTDIQYRHQKIGEKMLQRLINYCQRDPIINWIDLEVLAHNEPAINLYTKMNFQLIASVHDMFRIKQQSYDYNFMTLNVTSSEYRP